MAASALSIRSADRARSNWRLSCNFKETGAGSTWTQAHPFSFSLQTVLLEFEIRRSLVRQVNATTTGSHDNFTRLPDQRKFGSFKFVLHSDSPPFCFGFVLANLLFQATPRSAIAKPFSARLRSQNSSRMICRN